MNEFIGHKIKASNEKCSYGSYDILELHTSTDWFLSKYCKKTKTDKGSK